MGWGSELLFLALQKLALKIRGMEVRMGEEYDTCMCLSVFTQKQSNMHFNIRLNHDFFINEKRLSQRKGPLIMFQVVWQNPFTKILAFS